MRCLARPSHNLISPRPSVCMDPPRFPGSPWRPRWAGQRFLSRSRRPCPRPHQPAPGRGRNGRTLHKRRTHQGYVHACWWGRGIMWRGGIGGCGGSVQAVPACGWQCMRAFFPASFVLFLLHLSADMHMHAQPSTTSLRSHMRTRIRTCMQT